MAAAPPDLLEQIGAALGATCTVERELGGGGMSHVFVARDATLDRLIAVKVLPPDAGSSISADRFRREIALAARLQHPNIVPVIAAGATESGLPFYTMPLVDGESLRQRLERAGELSVQGAVSILRDVLRALAYAHAQGVVHRDVKPENILLSGGTAVVTDFGVAKALSAAAVDESATLTQAGVALGTPAYMSPEQASADPHVDARADLYAVGCVGYEMLTGHPPFTGRSAAALMAAHSIERPEPVGQRRPSVPEPLATLVMRCLEKRAGDRPQSAEEMLQSLELLGTSFTNSTNYTSGSGDAAISANAVTAATSPVEARSRTRTRRVAIGGPLVAFAVVAVVVAGAMVIRRSGTGADGGRPSSIAVLPFENTSRDTAFDYLADGISDQVRDALHAVPGLVVKARSSSRQMTGRAPKEAGAKLGVAAVLQGTISRSVSRLHVTAELVRTNDEAVLWSATFDGGPNALPAIQDSVSQSVLGTLKAAGSRSAVSADRGTRNPDAYYAFLQGRYRGDRLDWVGAAELFTKATRIDPTFARAYGALALAQTNAPTVGNLPVDSMNALAEESARRALALDSTVAEAYVAQAYVLTTDLHWDRGLPPLAKALAFDSTNADILMAYGGTLSQLGRVREGLRWTRRAYALDPLAPGNAGLHGYMIGLDGHPDSAIAIMRAALAIDTTNGLIAQGLAMQFAFAGQRDSAVKYLEHAHRVSPAQFGRRTSLVLANALAGRWDAARRERALFEREPLGNSPNYLRMMVHLAFDEREAAMTALERGVAGREPMLNTLCLPCDPLLDPLKSDPRFERLMRQLGVQVVCSAGAKRIFPAATTR